MGATIEVTLPDWINPEDPEAVATHLLFEAVKRYSEALRVPLSVHDGAYLAMDMAREAHWHIKKRGA